MVNEKTIDSWKYTSEGWVRPGPDINHFDEKKIMSVKEKEEKKEKNKTYRQSRKKKVTVI